MKKLLFLLLVLPLVVWGQDTTRVWALSSIKTNNIMFLSEDRAAVLSDSANFDFYNDFIDALVFYDVSNPLDPVFIDTAFVVKNRQMNFELNPSDYIGGAVVVDSLAIFTVNYLFQWGSAQPGQIIGPLFIRCRNIFTHEDLWDISILDSAVTQWEDSLENGYEDYLVGLSGMQIQDNLLVVNAGSWGVLFYNIVNPREPDLLGNLSITVREFHLLNNYMYFTGPETDSYREVFGEVDFSNPTDPQVEFQMITNVQGRHICCDPKAIRGDFVYMSSTVGNDRDFQMRILRMYHDQPPEEITCVSLGLDGLMGFNFVISGNRLFIRSRQFVQIFNIANDTTFQHIGAIEFPDRIHELAVQSEILYAVIGDWYDPEGRAWLVDYMDVLSVDPTSAQPPQIFQLSPAFPNPFNSTATIGYSLPAAGPVSLAVYDLNGRLVERMVDRLMPAGKHEAVWEARYMPTGLYLYRLQTAEGALARKMTLLR